VIRESAIGLKSERELAPVVFITGTDTGSGKTLLTALLLQHLRSSGSSALAMKPFCSGGRDDVSLLSRLQEGELSGEEINPYYFQAPVAPLVGARKVRRPIAPADALQRIDAVRRRCHCLLIEGSGGLLVPLGKSFFVADLVAALDGQVVIAARNKLGVINHALLTCRVLGLYGVRRIKIALMDCRKADASAPTNAKILRELLPAIKVVSLPFLGVGADTVHAVKRNHKKVKKKLARILEFGTF